jgi:cobalt-zinc-cadmium efflux system membrane fusion protein
MTDKRNVSDLAGSVGLVVVSAILAMLLLFIPKHSSGGHEGHGHGGGGEEEEEHHSSSEAKIEADDDQLAAAGITIEEVKSLSIVPKVTSRGEITENPNLAMNIKPRIGGIVRSVRFDFGDKVKKGDIVLTIESAATRAGYSVSSTVNGIVADKNVVTGSYVPEGESIMRIVDLSSVWFQGQISIFEALSIKPGQTVKVFDRIQNTSGEGKVIHVSPVVDEDTQTTDIRVSLNNEAGNWSVGSFADAEVLMDTHQVATAVRSSAIQTVNGKTVVFRRTEDEVAAQTVKIGWSDGEWTEIVSGLSIGDPYVATNSFIAKAELLKSTAEHSH